MTSSKADRTDTVEAVVTALREADSAVALTGAGVSAPSGIPTFREDGGVWDRFDPMAFHRRRFDADPAGFWADRTTLREEIYGDLDPDPNAAHWALSALVSDGVLEAVVTQNVDGLHGDAGTERVVELHGNHRRVVCDSCGERVSAGPVFDRAAGGERPPRCDCGGVYKPDVVLFGEALPDDAMDEAQRLARESDVLLAVGSSLSVRPASLLPDITRRAGGSVVVITLDPTAVDEDATYVLRGDAATVLPEIAGRIASATD